MRLTKEMLRSANIYNDYEYAAGYPYLFYRPQDTSRWSILAAWCISWPGHPFSEGHWSDYGMLVFHMVNPRATKAEKFLEAKTRFIELFGEEIVKTPFGSWMSKSFVLTRNAQIIQMLKDKKNGN